MKIKIDTDKFSVKTNKNKNVSLEDLVDAYTLMIAYIHAEHRKSVLTEDEKEILQGVMDTGTKLAFLSDEEIKSYINDNEFDDIFNEECIEEE